MSKKKKLSYKKAGVDIKKADLAIKSIKDLIQSTYNKNIISDIGGFSGIFQISPGKYLVSSTDGVGTKIILTQLLDKYDTIGIDLVAMVVNDLICCGANPLFLLDYLGIGKVDPFKIKEIVKGITLGCRQSGCALIGGEVAEMPDIYGPSEYDLAGFGVGLVNKDDLLPKIDEIKKDDLVIGLGSNGLHSNGYSLVRKVFGIDYKNPKKSLKTLTKHYKELGNITLGVELLKPTHIYTSAILSLKKEIKACANITGGGLVENIPRVLPLELSVKIYQKNWETPFIFDLIKKVGNIDKKEMFKTFNMGIGIIVIVNPNDTKKVLSRLLRLNYPCFVIGKVISGERKVIISN